MTLAEAQRQIAEGATVADDGTLKRTSKKTDTAANESSGKNGGTAGMGGPVLALFAVAAVLIFAFIVIARRKKMTAAGASSESGPAAPDTDPDGEEGSDGDEASRYPDTRHCDGSVRASGLRVLYRAVRRVVWRGDIRIGE